MLSLHGMCMMQPHEPPGLAKTGPRTAVSGQAARARRLARTFATAGRSFTSLLRRPSSSSMSRRNTSQRTLRCSGFATAHSACR